jgi:hypothetical protein
MEEKGRNSQIDVSSEEITEKAAQIRSGNINVCRMSEGNCKIPKTKKIKVLKAVR